TDPTPTGCPPRRGSGPPQDRSRCAGRTARPAPGPPRSSLRSPCHRDESSRPTRGDLPVRDAARNGSSPRSTPLGCRAMETAGSVRHAFDLTGRIALVTGAGSGIGRTSAEVLAGAGATVVCADLDAERAAETARAIVGEHGKAESAEIDVA